MDNFLRLENRHTGEVLVMRRMRDTQGQIVLTLDGTLPPMQVHLRENEQGIVKAGTLGAQIGKEKFEVSAGGAVVLPAGRPHRWWNAGADLLEFSGHVVPVDLSACALAPSRHAIAFNSAASHSANGLACGADDRARIGQIPRIELARFARIVPRCAAG